jgi:hypothetical protein
MKRVTGEDRDWWRAVCAMLRSAEWQIARLGPLLLLPCLSLSNSFSHGHKCILFGLWYAEDFLKRRGGGSVSSTPAITHKKGERKKCLFFRRAGYTRSNELHAAS